MKNINRALLTAGGKITTAVGTMWMAIAFTVLALVSLPAAILSGDVVVLVSWIAQTFLQLVLLSVIMVGQSIESAKTEARDTDTHDKVVQLFADHQVSLDLLHVKHDWLAAKVGLPPVN
jgi:hypothetical protein